MAKKIAKKSLVTCLGRILVKAQEIVTKSNESSPSLGGTSDEVLEQRNPLVN